MNSSLSFSPREWTELYVHRAHDELSERFLAILMDALLSRRDAIEPASFTFGN